MKNVVVLVSGEGTTFKYLYKNLYNKVNFKCLIYDRECNAINIAQNYNIRVYNSDFLLDRLKENEPDLIILAGYLKLIPLDVVKFYENKIINIHPSLLPKYGGKGFFGRNVHKAVKDANETFSGATCHYVDCEYDKGTIIAQRFVNISNMNVLEIESNVKSVEKKLLLYVVKDLLDID